MRKKVAVLVSGNGSNLQALIDAAKAPDYPAEISMVVSNKAEAYALTRAKEAGIPTHTLMHQTYPSREEFDSAMHTLLTDHGIEIVCLAGFMRLLTGWFVDQWQGRMLNIHPSLLPAFKGLHAIEQAFDAGVQVTGCTVHFVTAQMDAGPLVLQESVTVEENETVEALTERVHAAEHRIYPQALKLLAEGKA